MCCLVMTCCFKASGGDISGAPSVEEEDEAALGDVTRLLLGGWYVLKASPFPAFVCKDDNVIAGSNSC